MKHDCVFFPKDVITFERIQGLWNEALRLTYKSFEPLYKWIIDILKINNNIPIIGLLFREIDYNGELAGILCLRESVRDSQLNNIPIIWLLLQKIDCIAGTLFLRKRLMDWKVYVIFDSIPFMASIIFLLKLKNRLPHLKCAKEAYETWKNNVEDQDFLNKLWMSTDLEY